MRQIHSTVEQKRGAAIPDWAYRDVLFMLIHYSIASHELLEQKLTEEEKEEVFDVFYRVGSRMGLQGLPTSYSTWIKMREEHLNNDMEKGKYSIDLFKQYRKHLGPFRYILLKEGQKLVVPKQVREMLGLNRFSFLSPVIPMYKFSRLLKMDWLLKSAILPAAYKKQIRELDLV